MKHNDIVTKLLVSFHELLPVRIVFNWSIKTDQIESRPLRKRPLRVVDDSNGITKSV